MKERRQLLRKSATLAERILWQRLKGSQLGFKLIRQYSVEGYVVDFYCPTKRLAIELDGEFHKSNKQYDDYRTKYLAAFNIRVQRFWNDRVTSEIEQVVETIFSLLNQEGDGEPIGEPEGDK